MAEYLTEDQVVEFRATFNYFDNERKGKVSREEFSSMFRMIGKNPDEQALQSLVDDVDSKGNGEITFEQFLHAVASKIRESETKEQLIELFKIFDNDGNGSISVDELRQVMYRLVDKLTEQEVEGMVKQADKEGTGEIGFEDFLKLITSHGR